MFSRQIYQDANLEIRFPNELEAPLHFDAIRTSIPEIGIWESWCSENYCLEDSRQYLIDSYVKRQRGQEYRFCLFERDSGKIVGSVAINRIVPEYKTANIGYWIRSDSTGRSLAVIAVKAIARFAFDELGMTRLEIVAMSGNLRSCRVAEKSGAVAEGLHRNRLYLRGQPRNAWVYSLIPGDLPQ
ncbi:MAG: GNAT family N-acetyltransferase [Rouxiella aceris]|uniref:GNAT family N-acetyltransferase n=1 Tax=Rouxiella aceris TaxID=2703884 RepID=UPI002847EC25|nr:GNAT family N-acetyltransferase [Rouxiella aceris]MDR3430859.1 GNAT family N-acetyltransferase [Rouxiella aceris]